MLNKSLNLNETLFEETVEKKATRDGFGQALLELGELNSNVVVLTADLAESTKVDSFAKKYPERFIEIGVAEQNLAAVAAGLAVSGKIPFITSFAAFSPGKNLETIRTTIAYNQANVKIGGHHSGIATGEDGATHQATEDLAIMRSLPGVTIYVPCDTLEAKKLTLQSAKIDGPVYIRLSRNKTPLITTSETPFEENKIQTFWLSENPKATIFATGYILFYALLAARELEKENVNILVANVSTLKPLDKETVIDLARRAGAVVTCEDHQVMGGLGSAIAEVLVKNHPAPMEFIGLQNTFAQSGNPDALLQKYKMDAPAIIEAVRKVLGRKLTA